MAELIKKRHTVHFKYMPICENKILHLFLFRVLGIKISPPEEEVNRATGETYHLILYHILFIETNFICSNKYDNIYVVLSSCLKRVKYPT